MNMPALYCDRCGAANQPKAAFCRTCGNSLQPAGAASRDTTTGRLLPNHLLKQRYRILDSVGRGGMGAVYKAEDTQLGDRKVAIKEMSQSGLSPQEVLNAANDFKQEAHMLAGLQHPNLPNIYDHFSEAGRWYLVMSFIQGETLEDYLNKAKGGRLPVEEVLQIGIQLCTVLNYLHSQQKPIIFRDLKPSNIMLTTDGHLYLIDFGIARHFKLGQTKDTTAYGSIGYASPEQYGKAQTTPRSDIYSLGAVLYQLLSGHNPSSTPFQFPKLQSLVPTAPAELVKLITQMLEMDEKDRPANMLVVKQKLQSIASSSSTIGPTPAPIRARPAQAQNAAAQATPKPAVSPLPSTPIKVWSFGRRQLVASGIGITLCAIAYYCVVQFIEHSFPPVYIVEISLGVILATPLFFGTVFGPWVGLISASIGSAGADILTRNTIPDITWELFFSNRVVFGSTWTFDLSLTCLGFFAGIALLKTRGQFNRWGNIIFSLIVGCLVLVITQMPGALLTPLDLSYFGLSPFLLVLYRAIPNLILLPMLLFAYGILLKRRGHP